MQIGILQTGHACPRGSGRAWRLSGHVRASAGGRGLTSHLGRGRHGVSRTVHERPRLADHRLAPRRLRGSAVHPTAGGVHPRRSTRRDVPLVGICFGHQIIAQALGGRVEKFAGGWSVGRRNTTSATRPLALNAWHQDQVTGPPRAARAGHRHQRHFCEYAALVYRRPDPDRPAAPGIRRAHRGRPDRRNAARARVPDELLDSRPRDTCHPPVATPATRGRGSPTSS